MFNTVYTNSNSSVDEQQSLTCGIIKLNGISMFSPTTNSLLDDASEINVLSLSYTACSLIVLSSSSSNG